MSGKSKRQTTEREPLSDAQAAGTQGGGSNQSAIGGMGGGGDEPETPFLDAAKSNRGMSRWHGVDSEQSKGKSKFKSAGKNVVQFL